MSSRSMIALFVSMFAAAPAAMAEDMPHQLAPDLIRIEHQYCSTSTGYGTRFVTQRDVDGDGRKDVVLDYSDALCGGAPEPYCTSEGCLLVVWLGRGGGWHKAFEGRVRSWTVETTGGRPTLLLDGRPFGR